LSVWFIDTCSLGVVLMLLAQPIVANGGQTRLLFGFKMPRNSLVPGVLKLPHN